MDPEEIDQQDSNVTGVESDAIDYSTFGVTPEQPEQPSGQAEEVKDNPKWAPFLEAIPTPFHEPVKRHLKEWDQGINQRFQELNQQWAPFKRFREENIDPERLQRSYELANRLATDPTGFYNDLYTSLVQRGLLQEQVQQQAEQQAQGNEGDPNEDDPYVQRLTRLERQLQERDEALATMFQEQEQQAVLQRTLQEETAAIDQGFQAIETRLGSALSNPLKAQIVEKAMVMGQQQQRYVTIEEAANEVFRFLSAARNLAKAPPRGIPTGGGIPQTPVADPGEMTREQRFEKAREIRARFENQ